MGTKISAASAVSTLSDSYALPISTGGSSAAKVTVSTLAQYAAKYASGVDVVWYPSSGGGRPYCADIAYYLSSYSSNTPVGLVIRSGTKSLVVALTEESMYWSSGSIGSGTYISSRSGTYDDWDGESKTAAIIAVENDSTYAPGYCYQFTCSSGTYGLGAGQWWLPSVAELYLIKAYYQQLNFALTALAALGYDADTLSRSYYWSSSEYSSSYAWGVGFSPGPVGHYTKASYSLRVRPVSAFGEGTTV